VAQILDSKLNCYRKNPLLYYVQWTNYEGTPDKYLWNLAADLKNVSKLVAELHFLYPEKPSPIV